MHGNDRAWPNEFDGVGRALRTHGEVIADANEHYIDLVILGDQRHVRKEVGVACVVKRNAVTNGDDHATRLSGEDGERIVVFGDPAAMKGANQSRRDLTIEKRDFAAEEAGRVHLRLVRGVSEDHFYRGGEL